MISKVCVHQLPGPCAHLLMRRLVGERKEEVAVEHQIDLRGRWHLSRCLRLFRDHPHDVVHGVSITKFLLDWRHHPEFTAQEVAVWAIPVRSQCAVRDVQVGDLDPDSINGAWAPGGMDVSKAVKEIGRRGTLPRVDLRVR